MRRLMTEFFGFLQPHVFNRVQMQFIDTFLGWTMNYVPTWRTWVHLEPNMVRPTRITARTTKLLEGVRLMETTEEMGATGETTMSTLTRAR